MSEIERSSYVVWDGKQNPWCAPGYNGFVLSISAHDEDQIKVRWEERPEWLGEYTYERRKNLQLASRS